MDIKFIGQIKSISEVRSFETPDGHQSTFRTIRIETVEQFPQSVSVDVRNDLANNFPFVVGDNVSASLSFRVRISKDGREFNSISAWRIDRAN